MARVIRSDIDIVIDRDSIPANWTYKSNTHSKGSLHGRLVSIIKALQDAGIASKVDSHNEAIAHARVPIVKVKTVDGEFRIYYQDQNWFGVADVYITGVE